MPIKIDDIDLRKINGVGAVNSKSIRAYLKQEGLDHVEDLIGYDGELIVEPTFHVSTKIRESFTELLHDELIRAGWTKERKKWIEAKIVAQRKLMAEKDTPMLELKIKKLELLKKKIKYGNLRG